MLYIALREVVSERATPSTSGFEHIYMLDCCKVKLKNLPTNRHLTNASVSF